MSTNTITERDLMILEEKARANSVRKKAEKMTDKGAKELCAAIAAQAVEDYDRLLLEYFRNPQNPVTKELIKFEDFDYLGSIKEDYRSKTEHVEVSKVEKFLDSQWFKLVVAPVGNYNPDQIRKARRTAMAKHAIKKKICKPRKIYEIFKLNEWAGLPV